MKDIALTVVVLLVLFTGQALPNEMESSLSNLLKALDKEEFEAQYSDAVQYGSSRNLQLTNDTVEAGSAAIRLWIAERPEVLYISWWEQSNGTVRVLLALLLTGETKDVLTEKMQKDLERFAKRFNTEEARERLEELNFVRRNRGRFSKWMVERLNPVVGTKRLEGFEYTAKHPEP